jgi:2-iminobutanoate/2-iminopropanoate deaminase
MPHRPIHAPNLPKPAGPYSPGIASERLIFVSGQGVDDPATGRRVGPDTASQTEQCLCRHDGAYGRVFGEHRPARTTIQTVALPKAGLRVEIDCVAYVP